MASSNFTIDGSILEGGGQIIRVSLTCSSICMTPIYIENIRGKRPKPGLQNQHLASVKLLKDVCNADLNGANLQSISLSFSPKTINHGNYEVDSKTAGSVCLIMQSIIPTLLFAKEMSSLTLIGGTDAEFAPPIDYYRKIVLFYLEKMGIEISINLIKRGFYPRGGGQVSIDIETIKGTITPINITDRGQITKITAECFVAGTLPILVAQKMCAAIQKVIKSNHNYRHITILSNVYKETPNKAIGNGSGCMLIVETSQGCRFGFNIVGKRDLSGEDMGTNVAKQFLEFFDNSNGCIDSHMQDQILIFMAFAKGKSTIRCNELSLHSQTCIYVLENLIGVKFIIKSVENSKDVVVECDGLGISPKDY